MNLRGVTMDILHMLNDMLHNEMQNQMLYNKYMLQIQNPEIRQMFMQMRDGKMNLITQLQQEIANQIAGQQ